MDSLERIGGIIIKVIDNFIYGVKDGIDKDGLKQIGGALLSFIGALVIMLGTGLVAFLKLAFAFVIPNAAKYITIFGGMLGSLIFDVLIDTLAFVVNNIILSIPGFIGGIFVALINALPLPEDVKKAAAGMLNLTNYIMDGYKKTESEQAKSLKSLKENYAKGVYNWFNGAFPTDTRSDDKVKKGRDDVLAYEAGFKGQAGKTGDTIVKDLSGLWTQVAGGTTQVNPLLSAEISSGNIKDNLMNSLSTMNDMYKTNATFPAVPGPNLSYIGKQMDTYTPSFAIPNLAVITQNAVQAVSPTGSLASTNSYTVNIGTMNVGNVADAQAFIQNPTGTDNQQPTIVNLGVNVGT